MQHLRFLLPVSALALLGFFVFSPADAGSPPEGGAAAVAMPLKALLIAGGCCHDYETQHRLLYEGIQARANIRVDVVWTHDTSHTPPFDLFEDPDWAQGYDLVIHDECAALQKDPVILGNILNVHKTVPAVHLHCAMHSFRTDAWTRHLGIRSDRHGPHVGIDVEIVDREHPIMKPLEDWQIGKDELYNNVEVFDAHPLAMGHQAYKNNKGEEIKDSAIVAWTNEKQGARSFSTSLGHFNEVVASDEYLDLVVRGALWACGKLDNPVWHQPYTGSNLVHEITPEGAAGAAHTAPAAGAIPVQLAAISTQTQNKNLLHHAIDGDRKTRWCAQGGKKPAWFQVEFDKPVALTGAEIDWEILDQWMRYTIETSGDGKNWSLAFDASHNERGGTRRDAFAAKGVRFLKLNILGQQSNMWPSLWELRLYGTEGKLLVLHASLPAAESAGKAPAYDPAAYAKGGNVPPRAHRLAADEEAAMLADVAVPDGFETTLFAPWQMANYPTGVAAAPNGDLYVSSDGNGSIGRDPGRGRVLRLRDTDADGRADEVTEFVRDVDSPRGLLWDHDRLYLLHPPHITAYHDRDGDGVAESSQRLISNIAFGFKDRPADHTTNGLEMGIDGWIYIAVGDFGFMEATGADGRRLQMRGGGVVRFRPDGTGMETFSDGTRNIYGIATSPTLDLFARDNTNDGGGWNVRFHHLSGLEDHGYPRLYKNFSDENVAPLADYGGGSGCGGFYLDEPGIPAPWNKAPYTVDWGRVGSYRHDVQTRGATFEETGEPARFIKMTRPVDGDVDAMGAVYQASWKGSASFSWKGPEQGYIARVTPTGFTPDPLPDFATLDAAALIEVLRSSPSHVRRLNAQRMLLRRPASADTDAALLEVSGDHSLELPRRVAALYALVLRAGSLEAAPELARDAALRPFVLRALGDLPAHAAASEPLLREGTVSDNPRTRLEAIIAIARLDLAAAADAIASLLGSEDPVLAHTAFRALAKMEAHEVTLPLLEADDPATRLGASRALMRMHRPDIVAALIEELSSQQDFAKRRDLIATLARLCNRDGEWKGDSWSTRPDTRGPYYQPEPWEESPRILAAFNSLLNDPATPSEEATFLAASMGRNRIQNDEGLTRILALAEADPKLLPTAIGQLAGKADIPPAAIPLVIRGASDPGTSPVTLKQAVGLLLQSDDPGAFPAIMAACGSLQTNSEASGVRDAVRAMFVKAPKLENHAHALAEHLAANAGKPTGTWAAVGLLKLAEGKGVGPEAIDFARATIDKSWPEKNKKLAFMDAAFWTRIAFLNDRVRTAMADADPAVAKQADKAAKRLGIQKPGADATPKLASLKPEEAIAQAVAYTKGDVSLGEAVYTRATCMACHTVSEDAPPKGPYLGSIAEIYRRAELAEAIYLPNKTIAQGFKTNLFTLKDGTAMMGFVTDEAGDSVTMRDISSAEHTFLKSAIAKRDTLPNSLMPPGLMMQFSVHEFASLLDYLEALVKKDE